MSTAFSHIPIVNDGLTFYLDAYNEKSYVSGNTVTSDLVTNDFGKFDLSWTGPLVYVTDIYENLLFMSDDRNLRQSIYDLSTDTSYKFGSDSLYVGGGTFDTTEIVNGLPVIYGGSNSNISPITPYFKRYEYTGGTEWVNTFTKSLTNRRHATTYVDLYNSTNSRSDIWIGSSNNNSSTKWLTLHQWNGSDYNEYDFTSGIAPYILKPNKFVVGVTPISTGRIFIQCFSFTNFTSNRQASIVEMLFTGSTYTDVNDWSFNVIAGGNGSEYGDTDGVLGVNTLSRLSSVAPNLYKGGVLNGEPVFYFYNVFSSTFGNPSGNEFYIRKLFHNGSAWEVSTVLTQTSPNDMRSFAINSTNDKFYFNENSSDELQSYDLNTSGTTSIIVSIGNSTEQERVPKTIDLINGVGFNNNTWTFDGIDDYIDVTPLLPTVQNDTQGTIEAWVKTNDSTPTDFIKPIMSFGDTNAGQTIQGGLLNDGKFRCYAQSTVQIQWTLSTNSKVFNDNEWINVCLVQDGVEPKIYVNGEFIPQTFTSIIDKSFWINSIPGIDNVRIGCQDTNNNGPFRNWDGEISNVKYSNRPLTSEEVLQNYNATKWRFQ